MPNRPRRPSNRPPDGAREEPEAAGARPSEARSTPPAAREARALWLGASSHDVARNVLLVSEFAQAERAARRFSATRYVADQADLRLSTGSLGNLPVTVMSVGAGSSAAETALAALCMRSPRPVVMHIGYCTALDTGLALGDLVICQAALRLESTSLGYVEAGYPAFAHAEAQVALVRAAEERRARFQVGVMATAGGQFGAQGRGVACFEPLDAQFAERMRRQHVLGVETEASCIFTLGALSGVRAGVVCAVERDAAGRELEAAQCEQANELLVDVGLTALRHLARMERERGELRHWHDGIHADQVMSASLRPRR